LQKKTTGFFAYHCLPKFETFAVSSKHKSKADSIFGVVVILVGKQFPGLALADQRPRDKPGHDKNVQKNDWKPQQEHHRPVRFLQALHGQRLGEKEARRATARVAERAAGKSQGDPRYDRGEQSIEQHHQRRYEAVERGDDVTMAAVALRPPASDYPGSHPKKRTRQNRYEWNNPEAHDLLENEHARPVTHV
jgi:hypothetical protein